MNGSDEILGRTEFDRWRWDNSRPYDWADLNQTEKQRWVEKAKARKEKP